MFKIQENFQTKKSVVIYSQTSKTCQALSETESFT